MLRSLTLKNIRSFGEETRIEFIDGRVSIQGRNGAGKSTIIQCIGYLMFDYAPQLRREKITSIQGQELPLTLRNFFLRRGETSGLMRVEFQLGNTNYEVEAKLFMKKGEEWTVKVDGKNVDTLSGTKTDAHEFLWNQINASHYKGGSKKFFENIVCVMQGQIVAPFEAPQQARKDFFDEILGVAQYRRVEKNLAVLRNEFEERVHQAEKRIASLQGQVEVLPEKEGELDTLREKMAGKKKDADLFKKKVGALQKKVDELEGLKEKIGEKKASAKVLESKLESSTENARQLEAELEKLTSLEGENERLEHDHRTYTDLKAKIETVQEELRVVQRNRTQVQKIEKERAVAETRVQSLRDKLAELKRDRERLEALEPVAKDYESKKDELDALQSEITEQSVIAESFQYKEEEFQTLRREMVTLGGKLEGIDALEES
ncbi:MAG: AAA family ATPase, partial [Promethearchaeota archaeon]